MKGYCFFSVHEPLFHRMALALRERGVNEWGGFVWGQHQADAISNLGIAYDLTIFTRDLLPSVDDGRAPDLEWLGRREIELGVSLQRMLAAERHLLSPRTYTQIMRMAEVALRTLADTLERVRPDFIFSEDISCFHSYALYVLSRERGIPYWCITSGRLPGRVSVYSRGMNHWDRLEDLYPQLLARGLSSDEYQAAEEYLLAFRDRPARPSGMKSRAKKPRLELADIGKFRSVVSRFRGDPADPTAFQPLTVVRNRLRRIARVASAEVFGVFEKPSEGERFVLFPLHFQPEASTLVQAPLYVDQLALLRDIATSLPAGYRLYVKEHVSSRGRRPLEFYAAIRKIPVVRLLGPDEDTWTLIKNAAAIITITGTVGWEGLMFDKPVIAFGDVFFNLVPSVVHGELVAKDQWYAMFQRAIHEHSPNRAAVLTMISALQQCGMPGFIGNPTSFPEALSDDNVANLVEALSRELGI